MYMFNIKIQYNDGNYDDRLINVTNSIFNMFTDVQ